MNMRTNSKMTIWNRYMVGRSVYWQRFEVSAVAWEQRHQRSQFDSADMATVYIPKSSAIEYLSPRLWQELTDKSNNWTLQVGDVVAKGTIAQELSDSYTLSQLKGAHDDVLVITAVDTYDYGSLSMQHYRVGAK